MHALKSGISQTEYGKLMGLSQDSISLRMRAAKVADTTRVVTSDLWRHLAEIHAAPRWLWPALVASLVEKGWSVDVTRKAVKTVADAPEFLHLDNNPADAEDGHDQAGHIGPTLQSGAHLFRRCTLIAIVVVGHWPILRSNQKS